MSTGASRISECINRCTTADKYGLLHTEAVFLAHGVPVLLLAGQSSAVWRQWMSDAVLVDI